MPQTHRLTTVRYNFKGTEGTTTETGCRPASNKCPGNGGQDAINHASWCTNGNAGAGVTSISVTYDKAGVSGIDVGSNKSIIGVGSKGVIRGKGLRMANGVKNGRRKSRCILWRTSLTCLRSHHSEHSHHRCRYFSMIDCAR